MRAGEAPVLRIDLGGVPCPQNSSRALLALESMEPGEQLELLIDHGEPRERVPVSLEWEGHEILEMGRQGGQWLLLVRRGED